MALGHHMEQPVSMGGSHRDTSSEQVRSQQAGNAVIDTETPKGTLAILLMYAGLIVALWGLMYVSLLLRR